MAAETNDAQQQPPEARETWRGPSLGAYHAPECVGGSCVCELGKLRADLSAMQARAERAEADYAELSRWAQQVTDALDGRPLPPFPDGVPARIESLEHEKAAAEARADEAEKRYALQSAAAEGEAALLRATEVRAEVAEAKAERYSQSLQGLVSINGLHYHGISERWRMESQHGLGWHIVSTTGHAIGLVPRREVAVAIIRDHDRAAALEDALESLNRIAEHYDPEFPPEDWQWAAICMRWKAIGALARLQDGG